MFASAHESRHILVRLFIGVLVALLLFFWSSCARINGG